MKNRLVEKKLEVNKFLGIFKKSVTKHGLTTLRRPKNLDTLTEMGFTFLDVQNEIMKLTYKDFIAGPKQDLDYIGEIWEFGKTINYEDIFIKLKLAGNRPTCLSFHYAEREMKYFLK